MADIIIADHGIDFTGKTLVEKGIGGAEKAVIYLAEGLAERGHNVSVYTCCSEPIDFKGVHWKRLDDGLPDSCDIYIANRSDKVINLVPNARQCFFWIHNPATYLLKWRYLWKLWKRKPDIIFSSEYHINSYPSWAPSGRRLSVPYVIDEVFQPQLHETPIAPRAVFTSNPVRSLDWVLDAWLTVVHKQCPQAELHIFAGKQVYGKFGEKYADKIDAVLNKAEAAKESGVVVRGPVKQEQIIEELKLARVMPYRGDENETFCFSLEEAQAMGVPCVVQDLGCVKERVVDGVTGYVATDSNDFGNKVAKLLCDDAVWMQQHKACVARRSELSREAALDRYCAALRV